jgi:hypothetical protein
MSVARLTVMREITACGRQDWQDIIKNLYLKYRNRDAEYIHIYQIKTVPSMDLRDFRGPVWLFGFHRLICGRWAIIGG